MHRNQVTKTTVYTNHSLVPRLLAGEPGSEARGTISTWKLCHQVIFRFVCRTEVYHFSARLLGPMVGDKYHTVFEKTDHFCFRDTRASFCHFLLYVHQVSAEQLFRLALWTITISNPEHMLAIKALAWANKPSKNNNNNNNNNHLTD